MRSRDLFCSILIAASFVFWTYAQADDLSKEIFVSNAWVQDMPPSQTTTAAYMTVTNDSQKEAILVSAASDIAGVAEIHQMSDMSGMMHMAMVPGVHIPALGHVSLKPGGYHIMLINLKKPIHKGDIVPITLRFQDGTTIVVNAPVKPQQSQDTSSMPGMKM